MSVSPEQRNAFYRAAHLGLRALDAAERTPRRFGSDADARWRSFQGHLGLADRLDLLIRDAAVTWTSGFSPAIVFGLPGLASDEPFGPDWTALPEHEAKRLWSDSSRPTTVDALFELLGIPSGDVDLPQISAATQLVVAGGAAVRAVAGHFAANRELSWSDQVLVVASGPTVRQGAGLVAPLLPAPGPTRLVHPSEDRSSLKKLGISGGGHAVVSIDATAAEQSFVLAATRGS